MRRPDDYLKIPVEYCKWLGGLRWSSGGEAVEYTAADPSIGLTFALASEVALFLEGFQADGARPVCFGFVLHLLHLLGLGVKERGEPSGGSSGGELVEVDDVDALRLDFRRLGRPLRNAGALCAMLCDGLPRAADPPDMADVCVFLNRPPSSPGDTIPFWITWALRAPAEMPPLTPGEFATSVMKALDRLDADDIRHWFRHGRGPIREAGKEVARAVPRTLAGALAELERRPRLAAAAPMVAQLVGALALPPRRLLPAELPTGGYSDVATRGLPEQILPAQLALDADEFVRRFAERELLYFHREEPHAPIAEELVVVVDQGVRTWGDVRLVLGASVLALGRQAAHRKIGFLVAATSTGGDLCDPLAVDPETFGTILEASDLSPNPGPTLAHVLGEPAEPGRDVVLLTHPRNLADPEVAAAARQVAAGSRLFAVAVDAAGEVALSEVRQGVPVGIGRFRVGLGGPVDRPTPAREEPAPAGGWKGDVEPVGFPFTLGAVSRIDDRLFDFDDAGEWLLVAGAQGLLHTWRVDRTATEMLPRSHDGTSVLSSIHTVLGVAGGFVVVGSNGTAGLVAHYDLARRVCTVHRLQAPLWMNWEWIYYRDLHSVAVVKSGPAPETLALDLGVAVEAASSSPRAVEALRRVEAEPTRHPSIVSESVAILEMLRLKGRAIRSTSGGALDVRDDSGMWRRCFPLADGEPALKGMRALQARLGGDVLAVMAGNISEKVLCFLSVSASAPIGTTALERSAQGFALSRDGRLFARRVGDRQVEVRPVAGTSGGFVTSKGRTHSRLDIALGDMFLTVEVGRHTHLIRWDRGVLESVRSDGGAARLVARYFEGAAGRTVAVEARMHQHLDRYRRFTGWCSDFGLTAAVDGLGQFALLDRDVKVLCLLYVFRDQLAAWMPDGTRIGPYGIIGGRPTPDGAARIGAALCAAREHARVPRP